MKRLGTIRYPHTIKVDNVNGANGHVTLEVATNERSIKVEGNIFHVASALVAAAKDITARQRAYAMGEWSPYKRLKAISGYTSPDGNE